ncbi:uncharacterized protein HMF8227_02723 [Saliniradius amylolyticus]|uniref:Zinc-ribbon domain-containing protein n=2 Tax=Saliniradius amylolyticus TaxID=2183582 RepID=A0A2S2E689_9ALTE|nr:uncharacterized protein HMF8227_02723 [Saliniradius amylolyticus]
MIPDTDPSAYCASCRLTTTIPNLNRSENLTLWFRMEQAKRRLLYTLSKLDLPIYSRQEDPQNGLAFEFLEDETQDIFGNELTVKNLVTTGHSGGIITLNLKEAKHSSRMAMREEMNENYRTLLGHLRHESGHYYWDRLVANRDCLQGFRDHFGDERLDYRQSLQSYYDNGPATNWQNVWVSAYASMHPWEDWAETWAHYLHMVDTLETASDYNFSVSQKSLTNPLHRYPQRNDKASDKHFERLMSDWLRLTTGLNALNRSMGLEDAYPFTLSSLAIEKLKFVHEVIGQS